VRSASASCTWPRAWSSKPSRDIERKVDQLLNRLLEARGASVITAYERRVREL
jgi:hypothetical protein